MKILLISLHFSEYIYCLARELAKTNEVRLILNINNAKSELEGLKVEGSGNLEISYLKHAKNILTVCRNVYEITRQAKAFKPDIVHFQEVLHEYQTVSFLLLRMIWPIVLTVHDPQPHVGADSQVRSGVGKRRELYSYIQRRLSSGLITHGDFLCEQLRSTSNNLRPIHNINHGPLGLLCDKRNINREADAPFTFLFFGRMHKYKGVDNFVEAVNHLKSEGLVVRAILAGRGPELSRIEDNLRGDSCYVLKNYYLSPQEVVDTFHEADVVVLPYIEGTQSGVAAYAIGLGKPCIITRVGSLPEMVINGETGIIVTPNDVSELVAAMRRMYECKAMCESMAKAAKLLGQKSLSWARAAEKTSLLYRSIVLMKK